MVSDRALVEPVLQDRASHDSHRCTLIIDLKFAKG